MKYLEINYKNKIIRGFFHTGNSKDIVLLFHGFMGNKVDHHFMMKTFAIDICSLGFNVYRFDFLGSGDSDGTFFEEEGISNQIKQAKNIVNFFMNRGYNVHVFAFSLGGVIATNILDINGIKSLFLLSPAGNFNEILQKMIGFGKKLKDGAEFNGFHISNSFIKEAKEFDYFGNIHKFNEPVKIVHGTKDQYVSRQSIETYAKIFRTSNIIFIQNADHCYSSIFATNKLREEILDFYGKVKNLE